MYYEKIISFIIISFFLATNITYAHPGRTDKYGCHTCKTNCSKRGLYYGQYHCHKKK